MGAATIAIQSNEDFQETWQLVDDAVITDEHPLGQPFDLTGHTIAGKIKRGTDVILALPSAADYSASGIVIESPAVDGRFTITILEAALDSGVSSASVGNALGESVFSYDIRLTTPASLKIVLVSDTVTYLPGNT